MKLIILSMLVCSNFFLSSINAEVVDQKNKKIDAILDLSGIQKQTLSLKEIIESSANESLQKSKSPPELQLKIKKIMVGEFVPEKILKKIRERYLKEFSEVQIDHLYDFYNSPKTKEFSRLEEEVSTVAGQQAVAAYAKGLDKNLPSKNRAMMLVKFDKDVGVSENNTQMVILVMESMTAAFGEKLPSNEKEAFIQKMNTYMTQATLVNLLYAYRDISEDDLSKYLNLYSTDIIMKKQSAMVMDEYKVFFADWGNSIGNKIKLEVSSLKKK
jgi:hypothetical protein